jgi:hypothetical protein
MKRIKELDALKSDRFLLWVVITTLPLLCSNMYYVYHKLSVLPDPWRNRVSLGVALVLAGFIIIYTVRKNYRMAKYFAYFEALISAYYYIVTIGLDWDLLPAFGFTLILPAAMFHSAKEIKQEEEQDDNEYQEHVVHLQREVGRLFHDKKTNLQIIAERDKEIADLKKELDFFKNFREIHIEKPEDEEKVVLPPIEVVTFESKVDPEIFKESHDLTIDELQQSGSPFIEIQKSDLDREKKKNKGENDRPDFWERQKE